MIKNKKKLFIHDYFQNLGGGEKLLLSLLKNQDILVTSFVKKKFFKLIKTKNIKILQYQSKKNILIKKILTPFLFNFSKDNYNISNCIISGNYSVFYNFSKFKNKIFYCHSLPKIFFDYKNFYNKNLIIELMIKLISLFFKKIYLNRISKFDKIITNSKYTKKKINKFIKKKIYVIHPPIDKFRNNLNGQYFLSNSRHEIDKNIDKIIKAFNKTKKHKLLICSEGSQTNKLKELAKKNKNIKFVGLKKESEYKKILSKCISSINVSTNEDFGMSAIETMSAGKPPIVVNSGGYRENCKNNYNSFFINKNNIEKDLIHLLNNFDLKNFRNKRLNCINTAKKFSTENFVKEIEKLFI